MEKEENRCRFELLIPTIFLCTNQRAIAIVSITLCNNADSIQGTEYVRCLRSLDGHFMQGTLLFPTLRKRWMIRFSGIGYLKASFCNRVQSELIKRDRCTIMALLRKVGLCNTVETMFAMSLWRNSRESVFVKTDSDYLSIVKSKDRIKMKFRWRNYVQLQTRYEYGAMSTKLCERFTDFSDFQFLHFSVSILMFFIFTVTNITLRIQHICMQVLPSISFLL